MPVPPNAIAAAQAIQVAAAQSQTQQTRLIAGPGTGKSSTIEQRVSWLLAQGIPPAEIFAVSFTRASSKDLQERIVDHCANQGHAAAGAQIRVSTLHSLGLRVLRAAGLLARYPADPFVLDRWELENIFDAEFGVQSGIGTKGRREEIRRYHEAFWSTGVYQPANYLPPNPPVTPGEAARFLAFHQARTQAYACVLPGEIVRQCVTEINSGNIDPVQLLQMQHLIVDEFQDLNPMDLEFVHALAARGVVLFVAGDDDQSVYSFRFANPAGIQQIPNLYPYAQLPQLNECFRCMPQVLAAATRLITSFPSQNRIPKNSASLYSHCQPNVNGIVHRWRYPNGQSEAQSIAQSCQALIQAGIAPRQILILMSNSRVLERDIVQQLEGNGVAFVTSSSESFKDAIAGRLLLAIVRIVCDGDDYVAHRTLLGLPSGIGLRTCNDICDAVVANGLNFRDLFYHAIPNGVFANRLVTALNRARAISAQIGAWQPQDTFAMRLADITTILNQSLRPQDAQALQPFAASLPGDITLQELRDFIWSDNDEQQAAIVQNVYARIGQQVPQGNVLPPRVRIMTMHGAKGLSAQVVFIPGLEESILPGPWRNPYPGLVLEAARLLYVSITRARAVCIVSHATRRMMNGRTQNQTVSRFAAHLNGQFVPRANGLQPAEVQTIVQEVAQL